jgi:hypothetical protein
MEVAKAVKRTLFIMGEDCARTRNIGEVRADQAGITTLKFHPGGKALRAVSEEVKLFTTHLMVPVATLMLLETFQSTTKAMLITPPSGCEKIKSTPMRLQ